MMQLPMTPRRRAALMSAGGLAALGALLFALQSASREGPPPAQRSAPAAASSTAAPQPAASASPTNGSRRDDGPARAEIYRLHLSTRQSSGDDDQELFGFSVEGRLSLTPLLDAAPGALELTIEEPRLTPLHAAGPEAARAAAQALESLRAPCRVRFDESGRALGITFAREPDPFAAALQKGIAAALQFVAPDPPGQARWLSSEPDPRGQAEFEYQKLGLHSFLKSKLGYHVSGLGVASAGAASAAGVTAPSFRRDPDLDSQMRIVRNGSSLVSLILIERRMQRQAGAALVSVTQLRIEHAGIRELGVPARWQASRRDVERSLLAAARAASPRDRASELRERLAGARLSDLMSELERVDADTVDQRRDLIARFAAIFELDPDSVTASAETLVHGSEAEASVLLSALGDLGTDAADAVLRDLASDPSANPERRESALALLGLDETPSAESTELLDEVSRDRDSPHRSTAALALGSAAARLRALGDEHGGELFDSLIERLQQVSSIPEQLPILGAIGNSGDPRASGALEPWLHSEAAVVRAAAANALRLVDGDAALNALAERALSDVDADVRENAVGALGHQAKAALPVLERVLANEPDARVRLQALDAVANSSSTRAAALLERSARTDRNADVSQHAMELLEARG